MVFFLCHFMSYFWEMAGYVKNNLYHLTKNENYPLFGFELDTTGWSASLIHPFALYSIILTSKVQWVTYSVSDGSEKYGLLILITSMLNFQESTIDVPAGVLTRFCVVLGHVAVCQLVHLDIYIFSELKRRNNLKDEMEIEKKRKKKSRKTRKSPPSSASDMSKVTFQFFLTKICCVCSANICFRFLCFTNFCLYHLHSTFKLLQ